MPSEAKLHVELLASTPSAEDVVFQAARTCYSEQKPHEIKVPNKTERDNFIRKVVGSGHLSVLEHISATFAISGISRACSHQLVRHRLASYSQQSQRYVKYDDILVVMPKTIQDRPEAREKVMQYISEGEKLYAELTEDDVPAEDARFVLSNATETGLVMTMNGRELLHFLSLRCCNRAQWEVRALAIEMLKLLRSVMPNLFETAGPGCVTGSCPEGRMTCGKAAEVREAFKQLTVL